MTALAIVTAVLGLTLLVVAVVLLSRVHRRLAHLASLLDGRPAPLSPDDLDALATAAADRAAVAVRAPGPVPALGPGDSDDDERSPRWSGPRIKASGWAAGASETMRRLRQGA